VPDTNLRFVTLSADEVDDFGALTDSGAGGDWVALCNPYLVHAEKWIQRWNAVTSQAPTFGGLASGVTGEEDTVVFSNRQARDLACVAVKFEGGVRLQGVVSQGCRPIGVPYTITEVDGNVVVRLGSRSAFDVLEEAFESLTLNEKEAARGNLFAGLALSEYVEEHDRGDFLVRNIVGGDPQRGVVEVGAFPRTGQTMQFQIRDQRAAHEDLSQLCEKTFREHGKPFAGLLFSCTGRGSRMFGYSGHDTGVILDAFGSLPLSGFFSNGEIGPVGGTNFIHGYTASTAFFYDS